MPALWPTLVGAVLLAIWFVFQFATTRMSGPPLPRRCGGAAERIGSAASCLLVVPTDFDAETVDQFHIPRPLPLTYRLLPLEQTAR